MQNFSYRWYYDKHKQECKLFPFTECGGNKNNFLSRDDCIATCARNHPDNLIRSQIRSDYIPEERYETREERIDCVVSEWKRSACNVTCGEGFRTKTRTIIVHPVNGKKCPTKLKKIERCVVRCDQNNDISSFLSPPSRIQNEFSNLGKKRNLTIKVKNLIIL